MERTRKRRIEWTMARKRTLQQSAAPAKLSGIILLVLGTLKGIVAIVSGSVALLAGTIDSFSDVFSSIAVWAGLKIAKKKPTERFKRQFAS